MEWKDFIAQEDRHGDIETQEDGSIYRGPIKEIKLEGDQVVITTEWCANMPDRSSEGFGTWKLFGVDRRSVNIDIKPQDAGGNRIMYIVPTVSITAIFPKNGSRLDPRLVEGHPQYDPNFRPEPRD